jgi:hypothetical protein
MPVKRRVWKRRVQADPAAWEVLFECGYDYFRDLPFKTDTEAQEAAREAWESLGAAFLASRADNPLCPVPRAFQAFGEPARRARHAR